jgi:hypothetical protein
MAVTVNVNNLSLAHKGSGGVAASTVPDVCLTPSGSGPVPIPYPNIARSADLAKGTTTVKADGGNMIAVMGSEFSVSTGDEAGTVGGVISGTNMAEATWITCSPDVKMEGRNVCRLTDKMLLNHGNTVCLGGLNQLMLWAYPELRILCEFICKCDKMPITYPSGRRGKDKCVEAKIRMHNAALGGQSTIIPQQTYDMSGKTPMPVLGHPSHPAGRYETPDAVLVTVPGLPAAKGNLRAVVEIKFPGDRYRGDQLLRQRRIAGRADHITLTTEEESCDCKNRDWKPKPLPVPVWLFDLVAFLIWLASRGRVRLPRPVPVPVPG